MIEFLVVCVSTFLIGFLFPNIWWLYLIPIAILFFFRGKSSWKVFFISFISVFCLWFACTFYYDWNGIVADKMSQIFSLPDGFFVHCITATIGGLLGGLAGLNGYYAKQITSKQQKENPLS